MPPRVVEPRTTLNPSRLIDLGDQLAVAVFADQDVHLGPGPVIGRKEHDFVEEGVDIALAGLAGDLGGDGGILVAEVVVERAAELPDEGGAGRRRWPGPAGDAGSSCDAAVLPWSDRSAGSSVTRSGSSDPGMRTAGRAAISRTQAKRRSRGQISSRAAIDLG